METLGLYEKILMEILFLQTYLSKKSENLTAVLTSLDSNIFLYFFPDCDHLSRAQFQPEIEFLTSKPSKRPNSCFFRS